MVAKNKVRINNKYDMTSYSSILELLIAVNDWTASISEYLSRLILILYILCKVA